MPDGLINLVVDDGQVKVVGVGLLQDLGLLLQPLERLILEQPDKERVLDTDQGRESEGDKSTHAGLQVRFLRPLHSVQLNYLRGELKNKSEIFGHQTRTVNPDCLRHEATSMVFLF